MNPEMSMVVKRNEDREALRGLIQAWNANRLDLFELSEPNDDLEFHGVMRFYFQDSGQKVATKCIRVASDATAQVVIETLIEKFRPDMRMLSVPEYALYEIHENGGNGHGDERRLSVDEKPLLVQLNWHKDDREGRFLLRRIDDKTNMPEGTFQEGGSSFRRKLSKREKKQLKKQEKLNRMKSTGGINNDENDTGVAEKLYTELPETSFTRSISNPEAVMRRRRQQKLERKLQQFRSKDGGPDTGGTLKIYGESLCRDVPYKTLLLSVRDSATQVVKEMLIKYGLDREDPHNYCLVQVNTAVDSNAENKDSTSANSNTINNREYILDDDECPLAILMNHPQSRGSIMFHVRRRPADYHPRKRKKKPQQKWNQQADLDHRYDSLDRLPYFLELNPDGTEVASGSARRHRLHPNVTEVGSERASPHSQSQSLQLFGPNVQPRHCVIAHTEGIVTVTPCSRDAETYVNGQRIYETTILQSGMIVQFGRIHSFRFLDPCQEDRRLRQDSSRPLHDYSYDRQSTQEDSSPGQTPQGQTEQVTSPGSTVNYETTFDVDGNIETRSTSSQGNRDDTRSQRSVSSSREGNRLSNYERFPRGTDPILPAVLEIREETEEALLQALITDMEPNTTTFKLSPAYTLYLAARYRASTHYRPELTPTERAHKLTLMLARVAIMIHNVIQERYCDVKSLALWLANSSELLHFLKSDRHVSAFSLDAQDTLADSVQIAFRHLVGCLQRELASVMPNFLSERDDIGHESEDPSTASVLSVMSSAMQLLRRCRVNAALTIQLFSQLFHFVNVWAFNHVVAPNSIYCSRTWGLRIKSRLGQIEAWAERQGLELAADCHLARLMQAAHLLQAPKYTADDLATLSSTCFKLNSLQLRALLQKYQPSPDEPRLPHEMIENVVRVAENLADELARSDGREVRLEEDPELALPFLLPEDGYSCEVVRGVPQGLVDFIGPLQLAGLCRLSAQPSSNGLWTVYMGPTNSNMVRSPSAMSNRSGGCAGPQQEPDIQIIKLHKSNNGLGLSIVAAKGAGQDRLGIYIKSVVKGGAADADGRLQAGDQLLKVDGTSLVGITQEKAAEYLVRTGPVATLEVAKQGAIFHGLATLLSQPSPVMGRVANSSGVSTSTNIGSFHERTVSNEFGFGGGNQLMSSRSMSNLGDQEPVMYVTNCFNENINDWSFRTDPGQPEPPVLSIPVPTIRLEVTSDELPASSTSTNLLSVPPARIRCYKIPPDNDLCLCEDIFQEHQARLINCDSEDANAINLRKMTTSQSMPASTSFMSAANSDVIRTRKDHERDIMSMKFNWKNTSLDDVKLSNSRNDEILNGWVPIPGMKRCKSDIYLSKSGQWEMSVNKNDDEPSETHDYVVKDGMSKEHSVSYDAIIETIPDSSSTSECGCDNESCSPKSTSSASSHDDLTVKSIKHSSDQKINLPKSENINNKLTSEECVKVLKELDEMASGNFLKKINDFGSQDLKTENTKTTHDDMTNFLSSMLKLDLSGLKDSSSDSDHNRNITKTDSSDDEFLQYGCGRVAALARHFSKMGEAGIIRGGGRPRSHTRNVYRSEPDISSLEDNNNWNIPTSTTFMNGDKRFRMVLTSVGIHPIGFSMDRLLDIGPGVVLKEINDDVDNINEPNNIVDNDSDKIINGLESIISSNDITKNIDDNDVPDNSVPVSQIPLIDSFINTTQCHINEIENKPLSKIYEVSESECNTPTGMNDKLFFSECPFIEDIKNMEGRSSSFDSYSKFSSCSSSSKDRIIDLKKKAISVDEIDLRRLKKHNSLIDLGKMRTICDNNVINSSQSTSTTDYITGRTSEMISERGKSKLESFKKFSGKFCSSDEINKTFSGGFQRDKPYLGNIKRWTSVDSAAMGDKKDFNDHSNVLFSKSDDKGSLRRIQRLDAIRSRKLRKCKKLDTYRSFVITPIRYADTLKSSTSTESDKIFKNLSTDSSLSSDSTSSWWKRRSSVPVEKTTGLSDQDEVQPSCRPRRMSERDLPARVLSEQQQNHNQLARTGPMFHPQIHSSKSVPSLNSGSHETSNVVGGGGPQMPLGPNQVTPVGRVPHEVFNPGYSRTSSTNSLPQKTNDVPNTLRSRSSQNLAENRPPPSSNLVSRQASNPSLLQQQQQQQMQHHQQQMQQQQQPYLPYQQQMAMQQQQQQQYQQMSSGSAQITSPEGERFYQNLSVYRNQEINNGYLPQQTHPGSGRGKMPSPQDERSPNLLNSSHNNINNKSFRGSQSSLSTSSRTPSEQQVPGSGAGSGQRDRPSSAYLPPHSVHLNQNMVPRSQSSRDMLRQEAKLQEMSEEVRRRNEMRVTSPQHYPLQRMPIQNSSPNIGQMPPNTMGPINGGRPPQPGPPMQQQGSPHPVNYGYHTQDNNNPAYHNRIVKQPPVRGPIPGNGTDEISYRDSPPPPPPPPTSTHPLYQRNDNTRYAASMGEPPRGGYYPSSPGNQPPRPYQFQGTNPWEREEREKEQLRRREAARQWRDQQIAELVDLGQNRNAQQEEQLRALRLEREFQRRAAMEEEDDEEEDQEASERVQGLLRVAQTQQHPTQQPPISPDDKRGGVGRGNVGGSGPPRTPQVNGIVGRTTVPPNSAVSPTTPTGPGAEEKERLRRLKDLKMKQAEMEAGGRLKRRDDEIRQNNIRPNQQTLMNQANMNANTNQRPTRFEGNLIINSPANNTQTTPNGYISPAQQRLDNLLGQNLPPQPPERGSSFAVMSQTQLGSLRSPVSSSQTNINNTNNNSNNNINNANSNLNNGITNSSSSISSSGGQITPNNNNINNNNNNNINSNINSSGTPVSSSTGTAKRVSFQDATHSPSSPPTSAVPPLENIREDPNHFIDEAETLLASPKSPDTPSYTGTTPGVIGAQEVYKDPRQRRLQEQHQKLIANKVGTVPEKLSFKEKMKMFAMETGEDGTPRDKVKISRAQRDIDNLGTPPGPGTTNNVNNNNNNINNSNTSNSK